MAPERADEGLQAGRHADLRLQSLSDGDVVQGERRIPARSERRTGPHRTDWMARRRYGVARQLFFLQHCPAAEAVSTGWLEVLRYRLPESRAEVRVRLSQDSGLVILRLAGTDRGLLAVPKRELLCREEPRRRLRAGQTFPRREQVDG